MTPPNPAARRAARMVRLYPKPWRSRFGDELVELLIADLSERPHSLRRDLDVLRGAVVARLGLLGLCGPPLEPSEQARASLVALGCCLALFLSFGVAMWSQLTIGWQWSEPDTAVTTVATVVMSLVMLGLLVLGGLAAMPVLWRLVSGMGDLARERLAAPAALLLVGAVTMFLGARHFANGWPGTGGHPWAQRGLVPGGLAAFSWASTLSVSSYWAHPSALGRFPATELAWMALSPLALGSVVVGATSVVRRVELSARVLRFETRLATLACVLMASFLCGCCLWIVDGGPGPKNLFHAGAIDVLGTVVMIFAFVVASRAAEGARRSRLRLAGR